MANEQEGKDIRELRQEILGLYAERVVNPLLGNSEKLRRELLNGLESILSCVELPSTPRIVDNPLKDKEIDFVAIQGLAKEKGARMGNRLRYAFENLGIRTYGDLIAKFDKNSVKAFRNADFRYLWDLTKQRGIGISAQSVLYNHLNSLGINLFQTPYTPTELAGRVRGEKGLNREINSGSLTRAAIKLGCRYSGHSYCGSHIKTELKKAGVSTYQDAAERYKNWAENTGSSDKSLRAFVTDSLGLNRKAAKIVEAHLRNVSEDFKQEAYRK